MKRESLYLQGDLALNSWYAETEATATEENKVRLREHAEVRARHGESSTGLPLLNHPSKRVESPFRHYHPRLVRFVRCVLRKWRRYCPGAILNARWNTVRIELTFPNPHSPAIVSMLF